MDNENIKMMPVPLPTEVPAPPPLENLPLDILHSATVEMLIQQNEDLSARLKVNIRRNSQLELKIMELEKNQRHLNSQLENVKSQNEIIKEKHGIWSSQKERKDRQISSMQQEMELLETRYHELYTTSQLLQTTQRQKLVNKQTELSETQRKLSVSQKIRQRAKDKLRDFLLQTAEGFNSSNDEFRSLQAVNRRLKKGFELLKNETIEKENYFKEQFESFKQAYEKKIESITAKNEELQFIQSQLNSDKQELGTEVQEINKKYYEEKKNRRKIEILSEELAEVKNQRIQAKRHLEAQLERSEDSRALEVDKARKIKIQKTELEKELLEKSRVLEVCEVKLIELAKDNKEISLQLESLQKLWIQAQDKLEKEELRREGLEKINRELSKEHSQDRSQRAINVSTATETHPPQAKRNKSNKVANVYASQYHPLAKGPRMDL